MKWWKSYLLVPALAALVPVMVANVPFAFAMVLCIDGQEPDTADCDESAYDCNTGACSNGAGNCLQPVCVGEVLQQGLFGGKVGVEMKRNGPNAVCKKKYYCKWDTVNLICIPNLNKWLQDASKATYKTPC